MSITPSTAGLTRSDLRTRVRKLTGIESAILLPDADIDQRLDEAYAEINGLAEWGPNDTVKTVASPAQRNVLQESAAVGAEPTEVWVSNGDTVASLLPVARHQMDVLPPDLEGQPSRYTVEPDEAGSLELVLWPSPEPGWELHYRYPGGAGATFSGDGDRPWFAPEFHPVLAYVVASRLLTEDGDSTGRAGAYDTEVGVYIGRMRDRYLTRQDRRVVRMGRPAGGRRFGRIRR